MTATPVEAAPDLTRRARLARIGARLGPFARPHRRYLGLALTGSLVVTAAQLALPWPLKWIVDLASTDAQAPPVRLGSVFGFDSPVAGPVIGLLAVGIVFGLGEYVLRVAVAQYVVRTVNDARVGILTQWLAAPSGRSRDAGDVITRVVGDTARLRGGMKGVIVHVLQHGLFLVGVSAVLLILDAVLGLVYLAGLTVAFGIAVLGTDRAARVASLRRRRESRVARDVLRSAATPGEVLAAKQPDRARPVAIITQLKGRTAWAVQGVLALTACVVLNLAVRFSETGRLSTGDIALTASYILMLHYPMMRLGRQITRLGPQLTSAERLADLAHPLRRPGEPA